MFVHPQWHVQCKELRHVVGQQQSTGIQGVPDPVQMKPYGVGWNDQRANCKLNLKNNMFKNFNFLNQTYIFNRLDQFS